MYQSVWNWIQKYKPKKIFERKKKIDEFIIDETLIKVGSELINMALGCYWT
jgi:putative transposase